MLILNPGLMAVMSDEHLAASLRAEAGPLTSTPAEMELVTRLESYLDEIAEVRDLAGLADEFKFTAAELRPVLEAHPGNFIDYAKMLSMLNDAEIMDAEDLKALIDLMPKE